MNCLDGVDFSIGIRKKADVVALAMDAHTEDAVFGKVDVLIVEHLLFGLSVDLPKATSDEFWE